MEKEYLDDYEEKKIVTVEDNYNTIFPVGYIHFKPTYEFR